MKIHRLYVDQNGESHFEDLEVEFKESSHAGRLSARLLATGMIFREVPPDYDLDWHAAPRRQYIINLDAVQLTASDGETRRIGGRSLSRRGHVGHSARGRTTSKPTSRSPSAKVRRRRTFSSCWRCWSCPVARRSS